jgi:hypothetical protein
MNRAAWRLHGPVYRAENEYVHTRIRAFMRAREKPTR